MEVVPVNEMEREKEIKGESEKNTGYQDEDRKEKRRGDKKQKQLSAQSATEDD